MTSITGLRPDVVPHQQWALSSWFYAGPYWYYHRLGPGRRLIADRSFYERVDPDLRPICRLLLGQGLYSTPSCQGHFYPRERFEEVWDQLHREESRIRTAGLRVRDTQSPEQYLWQEPTYTLPWESFADFFAQADRQQGVGYLGILVPRDRADLYRKLRSASHRTPRAALLLDGALSQVLGYHVFSILVRCRDEVEQSRQWQDMTGLLEGLLCPAVSLDSGQYTFLESPQAWM